jgi:hypothetical protein
VIAAARIGQVPVDPFLRGAQQAGRLREDVLKARDASQLGGRVREGLLGLGNIGEVALHLGQRAALGAADLPGPRELLALHLEQRGQVVAGCEPRQLGGFDGGGQRRGPHGGRVGIGAEHLERPPVEQ